MILRRFVNNNPIKNDHKRKTWELNWIDITSRKIKMNMIIKCLCQILTSFQTFAKDIFTLKNYYCKIVSYVDHNGACLGIFGFFGFFGFFVFFGFWLFGFLAFWLFGFLAFWLFGFFGLLSIRPKCPRNQGKYFFLIYSKVYSLITNKIPITDTAAVPNMLQIYKLF